MKPTNLAAAYAKVESLLAENERLRTELSAMTRAMNSQREITIEMEKERSAAAANIRRLEAALWEIDGLHGEPLSWNIASAALAGGRGSK